MLEQFKKEPADHSVRGAIRGSILDLVMRNGSFTASEIADSTGYSLTTVAKYVSELQEEGVISEKERVNLHSKGRRTVRYGVEFDSYYFLGIDMRNFALNIALSDFSGNIVKMERHPDFRFENSYETLDGLCEKVTSFIGSLEESQRAGLAGANLNIPGRVDSRSGTSSTMFHFEDMGDCPLAEHLSSRFGVKTFIENDTKAMAFGEYMTSMNKEYKDVLFVNISWGLGLGIILDGKLYYGKNGFSGEFGHINMYNNNVLCHCGKKGCIETEVSVRAIHRKLMERIRNGESSILSPMVEQRKDVTSKDILEAAANEDPLCIELINRTGAELGRHLAGLINLLNPEAIILGGTLSQAKSYDFLQPVEWAIRKYSLRLMSQNVRVTTSTLGNKAGVVGACLLARRRVFGEI